MKIKSLKDPQVYIKRYPAHDPYQLKYSTIEKSIKYIKDEKYYKIKFKYSVDLSTSGQSYLIVGVPASDKGELFTIFNYSITLDSIKKHAYLNLSQYKKLEPFINYVFQNEFDNQSPNFGEAKRHLYLKRSVDQRLLTYADLYSQRISKLNLTQIDSLRTFINQKNRHALQFGKYDNSTVVLKNNFNSQSFKITDNKDVAQVSTIIPSIEGLETNFECTLISHSKPSIRSKRYPERNPFVYSLLFEEPQIQIINDSTYKVNYKFHVEKSNSGLGALILSIPRVEKNEIFTIKNSNYSLNFIGDTNIDVNTFQYSFLQRVMINNISFDSFENKDLKREELILWKDSLSNTDRLLDSRLQRWKFASFYYDHFNWTKKIFGDGFNYLKLYPLVFPENGTNKGPDYPHNPIISSFLYSGLFGGLFYIYFLGLSFYRFWKLRKELALFGLLYLLTFAFTFFSGNSHFSVPSFTLLSLLPFAFPINKRKKQK
jgi:hypothetical protein